MDNLQDTNARQTYGENRAIREPTDGKGRFDLLPMQAFYRQAKQLQNGAGKYAERNWERGMPVSRCIDSAIRHLTQYILGWNDEPHLDAAIWNLTAIAYYEYKYPELMDLPERKNLPLEEIQKYCIFKPSETVPEAMQKNDDIANTKLVQCKECGNYNMLNARAIIFHNKYILCKTCGEKVSILPEINAHD